MSEPVKYYYGYHKQKRLLGPVDYDTMIKWTHIIKLRWTCRGTRS